MATNIPKLNYDDFYKFITSFSLIIFILGILGATKIITYIVNSSNNEWIIWSAVIIYLLIASIAGIYFVWAMNKWYANQKQIDKKLIAETNRKSAELEKIINELADMEIVGAPKDKSEMNRVSQARYKQVKRSKIEEIKRRLNS